MNNIIPSTKLNMVSTHKLLDTTCLRNFYWRRVLNLESNKLNLNFWYGSVSGAGIEALLREEDWREAIAQEDVRSRGSYVRDDIELDLQLRLIEASLEAVEELPIIKRMKLNKAQLKFAIPLKCGIKFCGTLDGMGTFDKIPHMFEFKTAKQLKKNYKEVLLFDKQINGYAMARRLAGEPLGKCRYCILKKCNRRLGKKSFNEFVEQWRKDLRDPKREEFVWESISLGQTTVDEVWFDIEQKAEDLKEKFDRAGDKLLDPHYWPKEDSQCGNWSGCEFMPLCRNPSNWEIYLRTYKQRKMLYKEERTELEK